MIDFDLLKNETERIGITLPKYGAERFEIYAERLVRWNKHTNLTTINEPYDIVIKHFIDSLYPLKYITPSEGRTLADVGTGAGFPGLPLLIAFPSLKVNFIDSSGKRLDFIKDVLNNIGLIGERTHERAEDAARKSAYRESYDYVTARAVAPLNILCEYCLPFLKLGGIFVSLKGPKGYEELKDAEHAITTLGGELIESDSYKLPNGDSRTIFIIKKISRTPTKYPRKPKKIDSKPL